MVLDAMIDGDSLTIDIADPFHPDLFALVSRIEQFVHSKGADISGLDKRAYPQYNQGDCGV